MVRATTDGEDPFGTARLRRGVLDAWAASPARFREDANAEEDLALGGYRDRLVVELAQNAADAAARAGVSGRLRLTLHPAGPGDGTAAESTPAVLVSSNTGASLDAAGVESLSTLRASAKRDEESAQTVGRFGVGFAAVLAVSDEPAVVGRAGGVRWSLAEARELARETAETAETAETPGTGPGGTGTAASGSRSASALSDELRRRDGHVPLLRLPLPAQGTAPVGYDTSVVLPLRDGAAADLAARLLDGVDDALLLALPGLSEVVVETPDGVRTLTRRQDGPCTVVEDSAHGTTRWRTATAGGALAPELLADRPVEERLRPVWSVMWAVPVDENGDGAPARPGTVPMVHAPTPTDEPLDLPALLIASFPLDPTRRHAAPGPLTDFLVRQAAESYAALVQDWRPVGTGSIGLVPGPLGKGELDGRLRGEILRLLPRVAFLPRAAVPAQATETAQAPDAAQTPQAAESTEAKDATEAAPEAAADAGEARGDGWDGAGLAQSGPAGEATGALRPVDAEIVEGAGAETVRVLADLFPNLLPAGLERRSELRALGVPRVPLGEIIDRLAGVERAADWWWRLYDSLTGVDPDRLSGLPVPLAGGTPLGSAGGTPTQVAGSGASRTTIGPRQVLLPVPGHDDSAEEEYRRAGRADGGATRIPAPSGERAPDRPSAGAATLARLGLKVAHPDAAHPLLEKLGATPATPRAVLTSPQVRAAVANSLDSGEIWDEDADTLDAEELAEAVLALVRDARLEPGDEPWLAALALPDEDGELAPAGELVLPGSPFEQVIREGELAACDADLAERWGEQPLTAVGVMATFALVRATDVVLDPDELDPRDADFAESDDVGLCDSVDVWCEDVLDRLPETPVPPVAAEVIGVRDLDLVDDDAWPQALALLAQPPLREALTARVRVLLPDGTTETVRPYTAWWLRGNPVLGGRRPAGLRAAGSDPLLAGLYDPADAQGFDDEQVLRALGVRTSVRALLDEPGGAAELLGRLADPDRPVGHVQLHALYGALALLEPEQVTLPDELRAVVDGEVRVVDASDALVADAPDLLPLAAGRALLPVPPGRAADLAELLQVPRLGEVYEGRVTSPAGEGEGEDDAPGETYEVPDSVRTLLGPATPADYVEYEELLVDGVQADWRLTPDGVLHAATLEGVAAGLAWAAGAWQRRFEVAALLEDASRTEELARDRWFDQ
ncbi:sacsin N-terminal ATP-binding-like domain-containing protein [Streptomyces sp. NPDC048639]|uniref:sacsin N-terminal ATP-binding-like domain-containing protein n=1 Tax=Streptomyces sp. NPDC048639 TaxID=3365581 RepID=UPI0037236222